VKVIREPKEFAGDFETLEQAQAAAEAWARENSP